MHFLFNTVLPVVVIGIVIVVCVFEFAICLLPSKKLVQQKKVSETCRILTKEVERVEASTVVLQSCAFSGEVVEEVPAFNRYHFQILRPNGDVRDLRVTKQTYHAHKENDDIEIFVTRYENQLEDITLY